MSVCILSGVVAGPASTVGLADGTTLHTFDIRTSDGAVNAVIEGDRPAVPAADEAVVIVGRVRRRFFRSGGRTVGRTEVLVDRVESPTRRAAVRRAVERALGDLV